MKSLFIYSIPLITICTGFLGCDSTTSPADILKDEPAIIDFSITPNEVLFSSTEDGIKDTTVQVTFEVSAINLEAGRDITLSFYDRIRETSFVRTMNALGENEFSLMVPFETRTTFFEDYLVNASIDGEGSGNYGQGQLKLTGFSEEAPQILFADNEEELQRPAEGEPDVPVGFFAKVTDVEGMDTIEGVFIRLISRKSGEVSGSPFRLYDDGSNGDQTPNDSLYTRGFRFGSGNDLQTYDVFYYATDRGGLVSDTVKTTFSIVE